MIGNVPYEMTYKGHNIYLDTHWTGTGWYYPWVDGKYIGGEFPMSQQALDRAVKFISDLTDEGECNNTPTKEVSEGHSPDCTFTVLFDAKCNCGLEQPNSDEGDSSASPEAKSLLKQYGFGVNEGGE